MRMLTETGLFQEALRAAKGKSCVQHLISFFSIEENKLPKGYPCLVRLCLPCSSNKLSLEEEMALSCEKRWKT